MTQTNSPSGRTAKLKDDALMAAADECALWLPIESAPRDGTKIRVVCVEDGQWFYSGIAWWDDESERFENGEDYVSWVLTYWQPLDASKAWEALTAYRADLEATASQSIAPTPQDARVTALVEALRFYAALESWTSEEPFVSAEADVDVGDIARAALIDWEPKT